MNRMGCRTIALDVSETALRYGRRLFELDHRHRMDLNPQFLVFITVLVTLVALNLFGLFEITLSGKALDAAGGLASREGKSGAHR